MSGINYSFRSVFLIVARHDVVDTACKRAQLSSRPVLAFAFFIRDCRKTHVNKVIPTMSAISFCAFWLSALVPLSAITLASQITSSTAEMNLPDMNLILQGIEDAQHQNPAHVAIASDAASSVTSPNRAMRFISCLFLDRGPHQNEMLIAIPGRPGYLRLNR